MIAKKRLKKLFGLKKPPKKVNSDLKIGIVASIKDSLANIKRFTQYYKDIGFDYIVLCLDGELTDIYNYFKHDPQVIAIIAHGEYWNGFPQHRVEDFNFRQFVNCNFGLNLLRNLGVDWVLHADLDELVYTEKNVKTILSALPENVQSLRLKIFEGIPKEVAKHRFDTDLFKGLPDQHQKQIAEQFIPSFKDLDHFFKGHSFSKCISKVTDHLVLFIHDAHVLDIANSHQILLLHFDCTSFMDYYKKFEMRMSLLENPRPSRKAMMETFNYIYNSNPKEKNRQYKIKSLFKKYYLHPEDDLEMLKAIDLVKKIEHEAQCKKIKQTVSAFKPEFSKKQISEKTTDALGQALDELPALIVSRRTKENGVYQSFLSILENTCFDVYEYATEKKEADSLQSYYLNDPIAREAYERMQEPEDQARHMLNIAILIRNKHPKLAKIAAIKIANLQTNPRWIRQKIDEAFEI